MPRGSKPGERRGGRSSGTPNKATKTAREAFAAFVESNTHQFQDWLNRIAEKDPKAAFQCVLDVSEYYIPKLQRTELTGEGGGPVKVAQVVDELHP